MPTHSLSYSYHPLGFQARCTCGWRGDPHTVEAGAVTDAGAHEVVASVVAAANGPLAGAGSETLDEYRRRVV